MALRTSKLTFAGVAENGTMIVILYTEQIIILRLTNECFSKVRECEGSFVSIAVNCCHFNGVVSERDQSNQGIHSSTACTPSGSNSSTLTATNWTVAYLVTNYITVLVHARNSTPLNGNGSRSYLSAVYPLWGTGRGFT